MDPTGYYAVMKTVGYSDEDEINNFEKKEKWCVNNLYINSLEAAVAVASK